MGFWARVLGIAAVGLLIVASMSMNASYYFGEGRTQLEGAVFAAVSVGADGLKTLLPLQSVVFWRERKWVRLTAAVLLETVLLAGSLMAALGYAAENRDFTALTRDDRRHAVEAVRREVARIEAELARLAGGRPAAVIEQEQRRQRLDVLWTRTRECREATAATSRSFCQAYVALAAEREAALSRAALQTRLDALKSDLARRVAAGAETGGRLLERLVARLLGASVETVHDRWLVGFALLVELGSAFGPVMLAPIPATPSGEAATAERWIGRMRRRGGAAMYAEVR